jgi:hypothetical protein
LNFAIALLTSKWLGSGINSSAKNYVNGTEFVEIEN